MSFGGGWRGGGGGGGGGGQSSGFRGSSPAYRQSANSRAPCKFWAAGTCNRGASCNFSHDAPRGGGTRTLTTNQPNNNNTNPFNSQPQPSPWGDSSAATGAGVWGTGGAVQQSNPFQTQPSSFTGMGGGDGNSNPFQLVQSALRQSFRLFSRLSRPLSSSSSVGNAFGTGFDTASNSSSPFGTSAFGTANNNNTAATQSNPFAAFSQPQAGGGTDASPFASAFGTASSSLTAMNPFAPSPSTASPFASTATNSAFGQSQPAQPNPFQQSTQPNPFQSLQPSNNPFQALQSTLPQSTDPFQPTAPSTTATNPFQPGGGAVFQPTKLSCGHTGLAQCADYFKQDVSPIVYPFTSYTHEKCDGPCMIGDVSFEEWRWDVMEAEAQGRLAEVTQRYEQRRVEMMKVRELVYTKPELLHRDVSGWTFEEQVEAVKRGGMLDRAGSSVSQAMGTVDMGMGRDLSSVMSAASPSPTASGSSPFGAFSSAAAPSSAFSSATTAATVPAATQPMNALPLSPSGPPGGAALQPTANQAILSAAAAATVAPAVSHVIVSVVMSEAEIEQAWRAPAFAWGRIPELPPPAVGG